MKNKLIFKFFLIILFLNFLIHVSYSQTLNLSQIFGQGRTLFDEDGDGLSEKIEVNIIIPDNPTAIESALAAEIAARFNLESLALNFDLVKKESEIRNFSSLNNPILIGSNLTLSKKILKEENFDLSHLKPNQGLISIFNFQGKQGIICIAGSEEALLQTGRAFFLRWPYFWEIWGRESGYTYQTLEKDLENFFSQENINIQKTVVYRLLYSFPPISSLPTTLKALNFQNSGEIAQMTINVYFSDSSDLEKALAALRLLSGQRAKGIRTEILAYPACAQLEFQLVYGRRIEKIILERPGSTKRLLTPSYKEMASIPEKGKQFDLTELFSSKGVYVDRNQDGINDGLETTVVIPREFSAKGLSWLTTRLMLDTAGGLFPLTYLETEIENKKALIAPILIGDNSLTQELIKNGKLKLPVLEPFQGLIKCVPQAFGPADGLVVYSPSPAGLEKTLEYLGKKFPYLTEYQKGQPEITWIKDDIEKFLAGENGAAEAYFQLKLDEELEKLKNQEVENLELTISLPHPNPEFQNYLEKYLKSTVVSSQIKVNVNSVYDGTPVFQKEKDLTWEAEEALNLLKEKLSTVDINQPLKISLGLSESPTVRSKLKQTVEALLAEKNLSGEVEVLSAYKQGFFWLTEKILPALKNRPVQKILIRFAEDKDLQSEKTKRFYSDPNRWLQELYPVDEILARELALPLEKIELEKKSTSEPIYEVYAFDDKNNILLHESFSPKTRVIPFLSVLPEWGSVTITTGWLTVKQGNQPVSEVLLKTDLERFWDFYQEEILRPLYDFVLKKTNHQPTFSQQPYFKRLLIELWLSEPDYRLGLDEEIISSLEALHDEIYFDTLDFLRGITGFSQEDRDLPSDTSRSSAPGNVLPLIHPSTEGQAPRVKVKLEDFQAKKPRMVLNWKIPGQIAATRSWEYNPIKPKSLKLEEIVFNSSRDSLDYTTVDILLEKEADYYQLAAILESFLNQREKKINSQAFSYPALDNLKLKIRFQDLSLERTVNINPPQEKNQTADLSDKNLIIPTDRIIGPEECVKLSQSLARFPQIRSYLAGKSFEGRPIPVLEIYLPVARYVSIPRLITFKPTLHLTARQHANEVSATNYSLKFAELLATDRSYQQFLKKISVVIQPMENPDGAQLALDLWENEPFHSLHAGRYSSLGVDIGYQVGLNQPLLPEARIRTRINKEWVPDIYLNLHGYPSHEWVQLFSGYSPYLFRDYWIPKGWFTYFRQLSLKIYEPYRQSAEELKKILIQEMNADLKIKESNRRFYTRYERWAKRWSPFVSPLEIYDGLNIFAKRQSSTEIRLTPRTQTTWVEETPEVMDETAVGNWLSFLCEQGLTYLRAHAKYLFMAKSETAVIEEEVHNRIRIEYLRGRPATLGK